MLPSQHYLLISSLVLLLAAAIFAGVLVWHDTIGTRLVSQGVEAPNAVPTQLPSYQYTAGETALPHYPAGNINGVIIAKTGSMLTLAVVPPNSQTAGSIKATVIVDPDTQLNAPTRPINSLTLSDFAVGMEVNVLPKAGSVQETTLHAQIITLNMMATSSPAS